MEAIVVAAASAETAAAEDTAAVAATLAAVVAKEKAAGVDATAFPMKITANPFASRANRAGELTR